MTLWHYCTFEGTLDGLLAHLDDYGLAGWELVTIISRPGLPTRAFFKRPRATGASGKKRNSS